MTPQRYRLQHYTHETTCDGCGCPLYVGDTAYATQEAVYCSPACAASSPAPTCAEVNYYHSATLTTDPEGTLVQRCTSVPSSTLRSSSVPAPATAEPPAPCATPATAPEPSHDRR